MHATNTFPVDRHPQYRHYPTTIRSIASGIIIEVEKTHITSRCHYAVVVPVLKSILGRSAKVKESIEDPFK
jgi:hypothetical protein